MNRSEANERRNELMGLLKDAKGVEIKRITIPNPDESKYEGCALKIKKIRLEDASFRLLENFCHEHKLKMKVENGYWIIYTPKKKTN